MRLQLMNKSLFDTRLGCEDEDYTVTVEELQLNLLDHIICLVV